MEFPWSAHAHVHVMIASGPLQLRAFRNVVKNVQELAQAGWVQELLASFRVRRLWPAGRPARG